MTRQTFFKDAIAKRDLGHHLLEFSILRAQVRDLIAGGFANRIPRELLLASFEEAHVRNLLQGDPVEIAIDLGVGEGSGLGLGCDLTEGYIVENAAYASS